MSDRFTLSAQVLLTRRLNNLLRIDETVEIDMGYITCAEYQLFIDARQTQGKYFQPDHWKTNRFTPGTAKQPITGVRGNDAVAFCDWLTQQQLTPGFRYRIPTTAEIRYYPATLQALGCWCGDSKKPSFGGLSEQEHQSTLLHIGKFIELENLGHLSQVIDFDLDLNRALDYSSGLDLALDLAQVHNLVHIRARARARVLDSSSIHGCALDTAHNLVCALDIALERIRSLGIVHNLVHDIARDLNRVRDLALDRDLYLYLYVDPNPVRALDIARDIAVSITRYLDLIRSRTHDLAFVLTLNRDFGRAFTFILNLSIDFDRILHLVHTLNCDLDQDNTFTPSSMHQSIRNHVFRLAKNLDVFIDILDQLGNTDSFVQRFNRNQYSGSIARYKNYRDRAAKLYAFFALLELRRQGKIPAWEGIRIVRERIDD